MSEREVISSTHCPTANNNKDSYQTRKWFCLLISSSSGNQRPTELKQCLKLHCDFTAKQNAKSVAPMSLGDASTTSPVLLRFYQPMNTSDNQNSQAQPGSLGCEKTQSGKKILRRSIYHYRHPLLTPLCPAATLPLPKGEQTFSICSSTFVPHWFCRPFIHPLSYKGCSSRNENSVEPEVYNVKTETVFSSLNFAKHHHW